MMEVVCMSEKIKQTLEKILPLFQDITSTNANSTLPIPNIPFAK
jgi:hypothetical protein